MYLRVFWNSCKAKVVTKDVSKSIRTNRFQKGHILRYISGHGVLGIHCWRALKEDVEDCSLFMLCRPSIDRNGDDGDENDWMLHRR